VDPNTEIVEIIITATKRESTVQDTPISVTAISASDIANKGLTDFNSLAQTVPGIAMRTEGPGQTEFEMRGLNSAGGNMSWPHSLRQRDKWKLRSLRARISLERKEHHDQKIAPPALCCSRLAASLRVKFPVSALP
jgi:hypothetical protein